MQKNLDISFQTKTPFFPEKIHWQFQMKFIRKNDDNICCSHKHQFLCIKWRKLPKAVIEKIIDSDKCTQSPGSPECSSRPSSAASP
jgi:hypothetical protein